MQWDVFAGVCQNGRKDRTSRISAKKLHYELHAKWSQRWAVDWKKQNEGAKERERVENGKLLPHMQRIHKHPD